MEKANNTKRFQNIRKPILNYLIELTIVAFGVFLGMMVSENRTNKSIKENTARSMSFIISELEENVETLTSNIQYHEVIKKGFDSLRTKLSQETAFSTYFTNHNFRTEQIPGWQGIGITILENTAFESAKIGGILQNMDIVDVKQISSTYQSLERNRDFGESLSQKIFAMNSESRVLDIIGILELLTNDFLNNEKRLLIEINETVEALKERR